MRSSPLITASLMSDSLQAGATAFRSHVERIELEFTRRFLADPVIAGWVGTRWYRVAQPLLFPDETFPLGTTCGIEITQEWEVSGQASIMVPIAATLIYDEDRVSDLGSTGRRAASFADHMKRIMVGPEDALYLASPLFPDGMGNPRSLGRIESVLSVQVGDAIRKEESSALARQSLRAAYGLEPASEDELLVEPTGRFLEIQFKVSYPVDRETMTPQNFSPEE